MYEVKANVIRTRHMKVKLSNESSLTSTGILLLPDEDKQNAKRVLISIWMMSDLLYYI